MAQKRPGRYNIYIDGQYAFPVSENVLIDYQLLKGLEIDEALRERLLHADQVDRHYQTAINYLAHRLRTKQEVVTKLKQADASDEAIDQVVQKLQNNHLLDDHNYADSYVRSEVRMRDKGPSNIAQYLLKKGINAQIIDQSLTAIYDEATILENGQYQAEKLFYHYQRDSYQNAIRKVKTALVRKGYPFEQIDSIMTNVSFPHDDDHEQQLLEREFEKLWQKNHNLNNIKRCIKTKQGLYRKGFSIDAINRLIEQQSN